MQDKIQKQTLKKRDYTSRLPDAFNTLVRVYSLLVLVIANWFLPEVHAC